MSLRVSGASKRFGNTTALDDVSLHVDGGVFGLLGANGAGKSTLFRAVAGLITLDQGSIEVAGHDIAKSGLKARRHLGYLPEHLRLYDRLTGWELLDLIAGLKNLGGEEHLDERRQWLETFELWQWRDHLIAEYSLGMRKKIGLTAALIGAPDVVLLDEPLNGLDTESMRTLRLHIERMAAAGTTFVVSSHVMSFVERACDRVAVLRRGVVVANGSADDLRRQAELPTGTPFEDVFLSLAVDSRS